jgi:hypothetical protein
MGGFRHKVHHKGICEEMIVDRPALDWINLTTFELAIAKQLGEWVEDHAIDEGRPMNLRQYEGRLGDGWFIGHAMQNGKPHWRMRLSKRFADAFMFDQTRPPHLDCTRIDIQLTLQTEWSREGIYEHYKAFSDLAYQHEQARGQRGRKVTPVGVTPDGEATVYIGAQESERMYRLYVKILDDGTRWLRFEVQYRGKNGLAGKVYRSIGRNPLSMVRILFGEVSTLPVHPLTTPFLLHLKGVPAEIMEAGRERADPNKTLRWIVRQVMPAWKRVLSLEDSRDRAFMLLDELVRYAQELEK